MSTRPVICFRKSLGPPRPPVANNLELRTFSPGDERYWLRLHHRCFVAGWAPAWDELDFAREFRARSWWADNRMGFVVTPQRGLPVGTVTIAGPEGPEMHVAWLAVDPHYRRRGIGQQLMAWAEQRIWEAGGRTVVCETLAEWAEAVAFYRSLNYIAAD